MYIYIYIYIYIYMESCALPVITTMALWQLIASVRFEHSVCNGSFMTDIYIHTCIYIHTYFFWSYSQIKF